MADAGEFTVVSTEPVVFTKPMRTLRRLRIVLVGFGAAMLICAAVGSFVGYELAAHRANAQIAAQNADRAQNRAKLQQQQAATVAQVEQQREALCTVLQRVDPDAAIAQQRKAYHCGPYLPPGSAERQRTLGPASPPPGSSPRPRPSSPPASHAPHRTAAPPSTAPRPSAPTNSRPGHLICVLGICL